MITRTMALGAIAALAASAALAQMPIPRPRPPIEEIVQTRMLNRAQLYGMPGTLPPASGLKTRNAAYMPPHRHNRSGMASRTGTNVRNDGMGAMSRSVRQ